jgi:isoleucyl-tRNA synthetase
MDVLKDRLYCDAKNSHSRNSAQTVMTAIADAMVRLIAPVLAHTAEEAWAALKYKSQDTETVHLAIMPTVDEAIDYKGEEAKWDKLMGLRDEVMKSLEVLRQNQEISSNQQASISITADDELAAIVNDFGTKNFAALCIISEVEIATGESLTISAGKCENEKCERCWNFLPTVGKNESKPDLCERCIEVVGC